MSWRILLNSTQHIVRRNLSANPTRYRFSCKQHNTDRYSILVALPFDNTRYIHSEQTTNRAQTLPPKPLSNISNISPSANTHLKDTITQVGMSFNVEKKDYDGSKNSQTLTDRQDSTISTQPNKPGLLQKVKNECLYYYHGFKLFFYEVKISFRLFKKTLAGHSLSRREKRQFHKTLADIFRLVPFSVFIIVPFLELLLPVAIKLFPGLLPSTFQTIKTREDKRKAEFKIKLQMSKFLQSTITGILLI